MQLKQLTILVPISDIVSRYYWRVADCNPLGEIVISDEVVLKNHFLDLMNPLLGIVSRGEFLTQGVLTSKLVQLSMPTDMAIDLITTTLTEMQKRCLDTVGEIPDYRDWGVVLGPIPNNYHLTLFRGIHDTDTPVADDPRVRSVAHIPQSSGFAYGHPHTGPRRHEGLLSSMANHAIESARRARRLARHSQRNITEEPTPDQRSSYFDFLRESDDHR